MVSAPGSPGSALPSQAELPAPVPGQAATGAAAGKLLTPTANDAKTAVGGKKKVMPGGQCHLQHPQRQEARLRDAFARGLRPQALRSSVRRHIQGHPDATLDDAKKEALRWLRSNGAANTRTTGGSPIFTPAPPQSLTPGVHCRAQMLADPHPAPPRPRKPPRGGRRRQTTRRRRHPPYCHWCQKTSHTERQCRHKKRHDKQQKAEGQQPNPEAGPSSRTLPETPHPTHNPKFRPPLSLGELRQHQQEDPTLAPILSTWPDASVEGGDPDWETCVLLSDHDQLLLRDGVLHRRVTDPRAGVCEQLVIPRPHRQQVLTSLHRRLGHQGFPRAAEHIRPHVYWPGVYSDLRELLATCDACRRAAPPTNSGDQLPAQKSPATPLDTSW